jgi:hypothetical protein
MFLPIHSYVYPLWDRSRTVTSNTAPLFLCYDDPTTGLYQNCRFFVSQRLRTRFLWYCHPKLLRLPLYSSTVDPDMLEHTVVLFGKRPLPGGLLGFLADYRNIKP